MRTYNVKVTLKTGETFSEEIKGNLYEDVMIQVKQKAFDVNNIKSVVVVEVEEVEVEIETPDSSVQCWMQTKHISRKGIESKKWSFVGWTRMPDLTVEAHYVKSFKVKGKWLITEEGSGKYGYDVYRYDMSAVVWDEETEAQQEAAQQQAAEEAVQEAAAKESQPKEVQPLVPFDEVMYDESFAGISMFSDAPVLIVGEQKMMKENGETIEQFIYMFPHDKMGTYISVKSNIIITE